MNVLQVKSAEPHNSQQLHYMPRLYASMQDYAF